MVLNKKGMFFTLIAIALLSLFLLSYSIYSLTADRQSVNKRIDTMNTFVFSLDKDLPRQIYISGFRFIFLAEKKIIEEGSYISNTNELFNEAFYNGTLESAPQSIMNGARFSDISDSLKQKAGKINLDAEISPISLEMKQESPWSITVTLKAEIIITDRANLSRWNQTAEIKTEIPVENFEDPLYVIGTNGKITNKLVRANYSFASTSDLLLHVQNSRYIASASAPSFIDRLEGRNEASINGIESLVYLPELSAQGIQVFQKSNVDYIYFSGNNLVSNNVQGMPAWFRLDDAHLGIYDAVPM